MVDERNWSYERDAKVTEDDDNEDDKVTLAQQIFGKAAAAISGRNLPERKTDNVPEAEAPPVATRDSPVPK